MKYITVAVITFLVAILAYGNVTVNENLWHAFVASVVVVWISTVFWGVEE